jgi:hypothetical protein
MSKDQQAVMAQELDNKTRELKEARAELREMRESERPHELEL